MNAKILNGIAGFTLLLAGSAAAVAGGENGQKHFVFKADGDGEPTMMFVATADAEVGQDGQRHRVVIERIGEPGDREPATLTLTGTADADVSQNAGWLGVQLAITEEQNPDGTNQPTGVVVQNIVEGSAADLAGFQRGDVIEEVNDITLDADMESLVQQVRDAGPGKRMEFTVLRDGQRHTLVATLGRRGDLGEVKWRFETPNLMLHDQLQLNGKMLQRGDGGTWVFKDLKGLPNGVRQLFPGNMGKSLSMTVDNGSVSISTSVSNDQGTITVSRDGDGAITVTRSQDGADDEVVEYANEDELKNQDPEAYDIYNDSMSNMHVMQLDDNVPFGPDMTFEWDKDFNVRLEEIEDALNSSSDELNNALENLDQFEFHTDDGKDIVLDGNTPFMFSARGAQAQRTIRENPDGSIDVVVRKGGDELVTRYADVDDLQVRNPDAFAKYQELQDQK